MEILLGIIIGILISILILAVEFYAIQQRGGNIERIRKAIEAIDPVKGYIIEAKTDKQEAITNIIKENDSLGIETPYDDIIN